MLNQEMTRLKSKINQLIEIKNPLIKQDPVGTLLMADNYLQDIIRYLRKKEEEQLDHELQSKLLMLETVQNALFFTCDLLAHNTDIENYVQGNREAV